MLQGSISYGNTIRFERTASVAASNYERRKQDSTYRDKQLMPSASTMKGAFDCQSNVLKTGGFSIR